MRRVALIVSFAILCGFSVARCEEPWPLGDLYLSFADVPPDDPRRYPCDHMPLPGSGEFDVFLIAHIDYGHIDREELNGVNAIAGWEARLEVPPTLRIIDEEFFPATASNAGQGIHNYIVDLGEEVLITGDPIVLARFRFVSDGPWNTVELAAASPHHFPQWPHGRPGWIESGNGDQNTRTSGPRAFYGTYRGGALSEYGPMFCGPEGCYSYVERPVPGEVWVGNTVEAILFSSTAGVIDAEYTLDGKTWEELPGVNQHSDSHFVYWTVPNVATERAQIRMCDGCCFLMTYWTDSADFTIQKGVGTEFSSWGAVKARFD